MVMQSIDPLEVPTGIEMARRTVAGSAETGDPSTSAMQVMTQAYDDRVRTLQKMNILNGEESNKKKGTATQMKLKKIKTKSGLKLDVNIAPPKDILKGVTKAVNVTLGKKSKKKSKR